MVNSSFRTPEDAFRFFMGTGIDALIIGNGCPRNEAQDPTVIRDSDVFDANRLCLSV